jgi:hypothetical protein
MPWLFVALLFRIIMEAARGYVRARRNARPKPICADCFYAHVQYGAKARRAISCTYGGFVRPMKLEVLYCTDYRERTLPFRNGAIGFVREIASAEEVSG